MYIFCTCLLKDSFQELIFIHIRNKIQKIVSLFAQRISISPPTQLFLHLFKAYNSLAMIKPSLIFACIENLLILLGEISPYICI